MKDMQILNKYGFKHNEELAEVLSYLGLDGHQDQYRFKTDELTSKLDGVISLNGKDQIHLQIKRMPDLRYPNLLPSFLESYLDSRKEEVDFLLIVRTPKVPASAKHRIEEYLARYSFGENFNWLIVDDKGLIIGKFRNKDIKKEIKWSWVKSKGQFLSQVKEKGHITFSPIQQWLLKILLLNGLHENKDEPARNLNIWPREFDDELGDYKKLSNISGVSPSSCFNFIKLLIDSNYLSINGNEYRFKNLDELFQLWRNKYLSEKKEEVYLTPIRPLLTIEEWRQTALSKFKDSGVGQSSEIVLGGHLGTKAIGLSFSNESSVIFYSPYIDSKNFESFLKTMRLRFSESNEDGILVHLQKSPYPVMKLLEIERKDAIFADPIQLFLDVQYFGARGKEHSDYIYNKLLVKHFKRYEWSR
jgi:hypothetical protein